MFAAPQRFPLHPPARDALVDAVLKQFPAAAAQAAARADRILSGEYDLLGYRGLRFDAAAAVSSNRLPDWHFDPVHQRRAPRRFWTKIDYLDPAFGDHKIIWELNRHQHWLVLGRACWLTSDARYRDRFQQELASWLAANPPLIGINWASMLELALRILSWLWALNFFVTSHDRVEEPWIIDLLLGIDTQLRQVERNLSHYFSPNTHLLGEGLALYVAGRTLPELAGSSRRERLGRQVLLAGIDRQFGLDGGHAERSTHYHRYALDFYILALVVARLTGDPAARELEAVVARAGRAARLLADDGGRLPHVGDDDGGRLFPVAARDCDEIGDTLEMAAALAGRPELVVGAPTEEAVWMLGPRSAIRNPQSAMRSAALPDTGYYILRSAAGDHLLIDGGPHGYQNGGHAHADALSLTLTAHHMPLLVDAGTCCYTTSRTLRDRFRSSALHNTLVLDSRSQSIPRGPFHWSHVADSRVECWRSTEHFDYFCGSHNGYRPAVHQRHVLAMPGDLLVVADFIDAAGTHTAAVHWHVHPEWDVEAVRQRVRLARRSAPSDAITFAVPDGVVECFRGDQETGLGWYSPVYGALVPLTTVRVTRRADAPFWTAAVFDLSGCNAIERVEWTEGAMRIGRAGSVDYVFFTTPGRDSARGVGQTAAAEVRRAGELETDARMLFYRIDETRGLLRFALVDGGVLRRPGGPVYLALTEPAPDVHKDLASCAA